MKKEIRKLSKSRLVNLEKEVKKTMLTKTVGGAKGSLDLGALMCVGAGEDCDKPRRV